MSCVRSFTGDKGELGDVSRQSEQDGHKQLVIVHFCVLLAANNSLQLASLLIDNALVLFSELALRCVWLVHR